MQMKHVFLIEALKVALRIGVVISLGLAGLCAKSEPNPPSSPPNAQPTQAPSQFFNLIIENGQAKGGSQTVRVSKGSDVVLKFLSDAPGAVHLHAYHLELILSPKQEGELHFNAKASGKFKVEWHPNANGSPPPSSHEAPPLMSLEVMPL
jgi:hypothetical protein